MSHAETSHSSIRRNDCESVNTAVWLLRQETVHDGNGSAAVRRSDR